jgi:O-antigen/teichoic acid export membrane protein
MATATKLYTPQEITAIQPLAINDQEFGRRIGSISRQSTVYFAGAMLTTAAGYFFKVYVARTLGAQALGLYALGMTLVGFLGLFSTLGLSTAAARFVAAYSAQGQFSRLGEFLRGSLTLLSVCNLLLGATFLLVGRWVAVHFYHAPELSSYLWSFELILLFGVLNAFLGQVMAGYHDVTRRTVITHFIGTPANFVVAVILITLGLGLRGYMAAQVVSALLVLTLLAASVWRMTPAQARSGGSFAALEREVVTFSAAAFGVSAVEFLLTQTDKIVLGYYLEPKQVGIYAVAAAFVGFVPIALQSVNQIFSPTIAELHATGNRALLQQLYATLTKWILILTIPLTLTMFVFSRPLMGIFGPGFEPGAMALAVGAVGQLFNCAVGSVGYLLLMSGNQLQLVRIQAVNAVLMIALSLLLVPRLGVTGAAIAAAVAVAVANLWMLGTVFRRLKLFPYNASYFKLAPAALISAGIVFLLAHLSIGMTSPWRVAALALICGYVSFLAMVLISGLDSYDRRIAHLVLAKVGQTFLRNEVNA